MLDLMFFLLLGHYLGDFALQSDYMAREKGNKIGVLTFHVAVYTLTLSLSLLFGLWMNNRGYAFATGYTAVFLLFVFTAHWIQDYIKASRFNGSKQGLFIDQALHVIVLYAVRLFVYNG